MRASRRAQWVVAVIMVLVFAAACASPPRAPSVAVPEISPGDDPWGVVMGLQEGRLVLVGLTRGSAARAEHGEQLRAQMAGADRSSLEVRTRSADSVDGRADRAVTLARDEVRYVQVPASQDRPRRGGWAGLAIGAGGGALIGAIGAGAGESGNFAAAVAPLAAAAFGGIGYLIGRGIDRKQTRGDFITIYGNDPAGEERE